MVDRLVTQIVQKTVALEHPAHRKASAPCLADALAPNMVQRLAVWAEWLMDHDLMLAPVSALAVAPLGEANGK
jgi:hypothetical protein